MQKQPYKYDGDIASHICKNNHLGVDEKVCFCGERLVAIDILTKITRIPVKVLGFLAKNGDAVVCYKDGTKEYYPENFFFKNFTSTTIYNFELFVARMFSWGFTTGK